MTRMTRKTGTTGRIETIGMTQPRSQGSFLQVPTERLVGEKTWERGWDDLDDRFDWNDWTDRDEWNG